LADADVSVVPVDSATFSVLLVGAEGVFLAVSLVGPQPASVHISSKTTTTNIRANIMSSGRLKVCDSTKTI